MSDYETLFFWGKAGSFWGKAGSFWGKAGSFWCITRPVMDPGPGPLVLLDPLGLLGPLALLDPLGLLGPLALN